MTTKAIIKKLGNRLEDHDRSEDTVIITEKKEQQVFEEQFPRLHELGHHYSNRKTGLIFIS